MRTVIAQSMVIDHGTGEISIDGARLPWFIDDRGPRVEYVEEYDVSIVSVPFIVESVAELTTFEQDIEWIRDLGRRELEHARSWFAYRLTRPRDGEWSKADVASWFGFSPEEAEEIL